MPVRDYPEEYSNKRMTPEKAVQIVKDGDWVDYGTATSVPHDLDRALADRADDFSEIFVRGLLIYHPLAILDANRRLGRRVFHWNSWFMQPQDRRMLDEDLTSFIPMRFSELCMMYRRPTDVECVDVYMLNVGPMDENGNFNLGPSIVNNIEVMKRAKHVIVEVNPHLPFVYGLAHDHLHISDVDAIVESDAPMDTIPVVEPTETDKKIAGLIMKEIRDGDTLQLGIGGMPNAVGFMIANSDLKDIGIHTEMYVDSMMEMTKSGIVTGMRKALNPGKQVFTFTMGSQALYDWMDRNQALLTAPVDYCTSPAVVSQIPHFVSINNCVNIDLMGQINAESVGPRHLSGTGGQLDFMMGAAASEGGKAIIAMSSTFTNKKTGKTESRILPVLPAGTTITDASSTSQYVVTEYGMANLRGKALWQRAEALIGIAHPDFRDELIREAEKLHIWRPSNKR